MIENAKTTAEVEDATAAVEARIAAELDEPQEAKEAGFGGAAAFADAETREILSLLGDASGGGSCCGGSCCSA